MLLYIIIINIVISTTAPYKKSFLWGGGDVGGSKRGRYKSVSANS